MDNNSAAGRGSCRQNSRQSRSFGEGCRETPDLHDKYLESLGLFRKHTSPDASCLFRAVSEQRYDVQLHHERIRRECVAYMRENRSLFEKEIKWDFDLYMEKMMQPDTYGTLLELKALAMRHKADVQLYKPNSDGIWVVQKYDHYRVWNLFVDRDNHFDSVYSLGYIQLAAICQAISYVVLYKKVMRLPDIEFAVERMLYDPEGNKMMYSNEYGGLFAYMADGRRIQMQSAAGTCCVLKYPNLCHFHNLDDYDLIQRFFNVYGVEEGCRKYLGNNFREGLRKSDPLLPKAVMSCVRQLLDMNITPIPYKVAKALAPNIYRNVEYDVWLEGYSDNREIKVHPSTRSYRTATGTLRNPLCSSAEKFIHPRKIIDQCLMHLKQLYTGTVYNPAFFAPQTATEQEQIVPDSFAPPTTEPIPHVTVEGNVGGPFAPPQSEAQSVPFPDPIPMPEGGMCYIYLPRTTQQPLYPSVFRNPIIVPEAMAFTEPPPPIPEPVPQQDNIAMGARQHLFLTPPPPYYQHLQQGPSGTPYPPPHLYQQPNGINLVNEPMGQVPLRPPPCPQLHQPQNYAMGFRYPPTPLQHHQTPLNPYAPPFEIGRSSQLVQPELGYPFPPPTSPPQPNLANNPGFGHFSSN
uniref:OTU domain-containing protein n=1 Tax=Anopheles farauti TaxID=69004 RepID=A0A182QIM3_9DIPT